MGRWLVFAGIGMLILGGLFMLGSRVPWLRIGHLPGDIAVQREGFSFHFPITTMILVSVILTLVMWAVRAMQR